jgi:hypothetical protein
MRTVEKMSPTSLHLWESQREEYYKRYLADFKRPRDRQGEAASVGSSFDAFVKCELHHDLFGHDGDGVYNLESLFESQVQEEEVREWAWDAGKYTLDCYKKYGLYYELLSELEASDEDPQFEFTLTGTVGGVPLVGKPDLWYRRGVQVIYDWKVTGFCSKRSVSPGKLYKACRDCWGMNLAKPTRGGGQAKSHPKYTEIDFHGHRIGEHFLEDTNKKWADQIAIYSWMMGTEPGDEDVITGIDQLTCKPGPKGARFPLIRVAQHRCRISKEWQLGLLARLQKAWGQIQSGHIFDDLLRENSDAICEVLDMQQDDDDLLWQAINEREYRG